MKPFLAPLTILALLFIITPTHAEVCIQGNDNVCPPLNTSNADQAKNGNLEVLRLRSTQAILANPGPGQSYDFPTGDKALNLVSLIGIGSPKYCDQKGDNCFTPAQISTLLTPNSTPTCTNGTLANNVCTCPTTYPTLIAGNCYNLGTSGAPTDGSLDWVKKLKVSPTNEWATGVAQTDGTLYTSGNTYIGGQLCIRNGFNPTTGQPKWGCKTGAEWAALGGNNNNDIGSQIKDYLYSNCKLEIAGIDNVKANSIQEVIDSTSKTKDIVSGRIGSDVVFPGGSKNEYWNSNDNVIFRISCE